VQEFYEALYKRGGIEEKSIDEVLDSVDKVLSKDITELCAF